MPIKVYGKASDIAYHLLEDENYDGSMTIDELELLRQVLTQLESTEKQLTETQANLEKAKKVIRVVKERPKSAEAHRLAIQYLADCKDSQEED